MCRGTEVVAAVDVSTHLPVCRKHASSTDQEDPIDVAGWTADDEGNEGGALAGEGKPRMGGMLEWVLMMSRVVMLVGVYGHAEGKVLRLMDVPDTADMGDMGARYNELSSASGVMSGVGWSKLVRWAFSGVM